MHCSYVKYYVQDSGPSSPGYITHVVLPTDTLQGLSLKYGVAISEIRSENRLMTSNLHEKHTLRIPERKKFTVEQEVNLSELEAMMQRRLVGRFKKMTSILEMSEALFYLEATEYDLEAAIKSYHEDSSWERSHPLRRAAEPPSSCKSEVNKKSKKKQKVCLCFPLVY